jgi:hypothetical protein
MDYNNQYFVLVVDNEYFTIGLVADGNGSGSNSGVGAQLGLNFIAKKIIAYIDLDWKTTLKADIQAYSKDLASWYSSSLKDFIHNFLLYHCRIRCKRRYFNHFFIG